MDTFYKIDDLTLQEKKNLMIDCKKICFNYWIDKLDCSESWRRQRTDMTFDEIMEKCDENTHFVFIDREYFPKDEKKHFEVGFRVMSAIDYFLFLWIEDETIQDVIKKYKLEKMK